MKKLLPMLLLVLLVGCSKPNVSTPNPTDVDKIENNGKNPIATIVMKSGDTIELELYPDTAPNTVYNFIALANDGFYDGLIFHRVIPGFMIQGGDPEGTGMGGPGYNIAGEFSSNGVINDISHTRGVISMARSQAYDTAGSQFFIMHEDNTGLDSQYAAFGLVTKGLETVDAIASVETGKNDRPVDESKVTIDTIRVETFDVSYPQPQKMN